MRAAGAAVGPAGAGGCTRRWPNLLPWLPRARATRLGRMKIYWIDRREQLLALASPVRQDVADRLGAMGPCTVAELAQALGCGATALYRHLEALRRVGLVRIVKGPRGRGRPATRYSLVAPLVRWSRAARKPGNRGPMVRAARAMATRAARDYAQGFGAPHWKIDGSGRNHWMFRLVNRLSAARLKAINRHLDAVARLAYTPDPRGGELVSIACLLAPVADRRRAGGRARTGR